MDRLVRTEVKEVEIIYKKGQKCTATFKITNLMHTMSVAISLSTTTTFTNSSSSVFSFSHPLSIISPQSTVSYTVVLSSSSDVPPPLSSTISVSSAMLPTGKATADDLRKLFSVPGRHVFRDAVIPIAVVGHQVAERIVSDCGDVYSSKCFEKAVSRCSVSQLNGLLRSAVGSGNADFVRILIEKGGDLNRRDSQGRSLLSLAVKGGHVDVVKLLIDSGCRGIVGSDSCLHDAAAANRVDILQILTVNFRCIDMNSTDSSGRTPIHLAAINGHEKAIRFISFAGGDSDLADKKGFTPLHLAAEKGHLKATKCLMETSIYAKQAVNKAEKTPYDLAVENGHCGELCELLSPIGDELQRRSVTGDAEGVRRCLGEGAEVNVRDQNGWSPLHRAAFKGKAESVKVLLGKGAEVDAVDGDGYTPLHCAVEAGQLKVAVMLIGHGAKVSLKGVKGGFPFGLSLKNHPARVIDLCEEQKR